MRVCFRKEECWTTIRQERYRLSKLTSYNEGNVSFECLRLLDWLLGDKAKSHPNDTK